MTPSKLPSFKHNEYVHIWLSSAQPESDLPNAKADERETLNQSGKRSRSHASPPGHRRKHRHAEHEHHGQATTDVGAKQPSRKRQISTRSSPPPPNKVESAVAVDPRHYLHRVAQDRAVVTDRRIESDPHSKPLAGPNTPKFPGKHDPSFKYARRPRHKTREDRYEYKGHEDAKRVQKIAGHNKRSARRKSGATLNEEFQAPNVDSERLTLKQTSGPGFLSKGKSSDPTTRRGIPDLTFSEMTFLNRRRDLDGARFRGLTEQERPKKTTKGSAQDVSEFFAQPAQPGPPAMSSQDDLYGRGKALDGSAHVVSPLRSARRQTLSEMSPNRYETEARAPNSGKTWHPDPHESRSQHFRVEEKLSNTDIPADGAPSYISCSPPIDYQRDRGHHVEISEVATSLHDRRVLNRRSQNSPQAAYTVHPRSSVSNVLRVKKQRSPSYHSPLDQALAKAQAQTRSPKVYYSLEDLKSMAKDIGAMAHEPTHDELFLRHSPPYQQPRSRSFMLTPPESVPLTAEIDVRCATSELVHNVMVEEQDAQGYIVPRRDNSIQKEHYDQPQHLVPRFAHSAKAHPLLPAGPSLWNEAPSILLDSALRSTEPRAEAYKEGSFEQEDADYDDANVPQSHYDLMNRQFVLSHQQHFTQPEFVPIGEDGLDAFDAELLETVRELPLYVDHRTRGPEPLLSAPRQRARPPIEPDGRELNDHHDCHRQVRPQAATNSSFNQPTVFQHEECLRPQLLRPSEDQSLELEPFTGFSRPCILY